MKLQRGFSLIELILVIVIVSIAAVMLLSSFSYVGTSIIVSDDLQVGLQVAQECGDYIITSRRDVSNDYVGIDNTTCDALVLPSGFTRSITITVENSTTLPACPSSACKKVAISVSKGATSITDITTVLVDY